MVIFPWYFKYFLGSGWDPWGNQCRTHPWEFRHGWANAVKVVWMPNLRSYKGISAKTSFSKLPSSTNPKIMGFAKNAPQEIF